MDSDASTRPIRTTVVWALMVFALTGLCLLPVFLYRIDLSHISAASDFPIVAGVGILLTAYAPSVASLLAAWRLPGAGGVRELVRPMRRWRVPWRWYCISILGPIALFVVGRLILDSVGGLPVGRVVQLPAATAVGVLIGSLVGGALGEEVGWRGLGQRQLQLRLAPLWAALLVGVLWSAWHLWPLITPGGWDTSSSSEAAITLARLTASSVIYAWIFNSTNGSLLMVMIAHTGHNIANAIVPSARGDHFELVVAVLYVGAAMAVVVVTGRALGRRVDLGGADQPPS